MRETRALSAVFPICDIGALKKDLGKGFMNEFSYLNKLKLLCVGDEHEMVQRVLVGCRLPDEDL